MSFQVGSACYGTAQAAAQSQASAQVGAIVQHGQAAYVVGVSDTSDTSITYVLAPIGGGTSITTIVPYTAQPCNLLTMEDGLQLGWAVAACFLAVFAVLFISRGLRGETGGDYGNT